MNAPLVIDPEFEAMCPPLTDEEYEQLEENIIAEGEVLMPLIVWDGVIIDGHNRYKIAQAYPAVKYSTREKSFSNRYEAISWICKNQLGRRNLTPQQKKYLIGQRYEAEKMALGGDRKSEDAKSMGQNSPLISQHITRANIAKETNTTESFVKYAGQYAKGVDAAEEAVPGIKREILSGSIRPTAKEVAAVAKAPPETRRQMTEDLRKPKDADDSHTRASPSPAKSSRQEMKEARAICADMIETVASVSEDSVLETLHGAVTDMIRVCDTLFEDFPRLLQDGTYKRKVIEIMQEPKSYILQIEGVSI